MNVTFKQARELIIRTLKAGLVPNLLGSPGVGKSDLINGITKEFNLHIIDFRLAQADPTDLGGFPTLNEDRTRSHYAAPMNLPLVGDPIPEGCKGWLLFFDEMNAAPQLVQAAAYKIVLDRMVGDQHIHPKVMIACAGNLITDRAITNRTSTAMQSRLVHLKLEVDHNSWIEWAITNKVDHRIIGFLQFRPELLHNFSADHNDNTFPCPRTWHFLSKILKGLDTVTTQELPLVMGTVGQGAAIEFMEFTKYYTNLPTFEDMVKNPALVTIPIEPSILYALTSLIASRANEDNIDQLVKIINKLPLEFQVVTVRNILVQVSTAMLETPALKTWLSENAVHMA